VSVRHSGRASQAVQHSDVVVIGGGIVGASSTFFLRRRGCSVALLERFLVGQQASGTNFGNVRRQGRPLFEIPLANRASEIWRRMPELVAVKADAVDVKAPEPAGTVGGEVKKVAVGRDTGRALVIGRIERGDFGGAAGVQRRRR